MTSALSKPQGKRGLAPKRGRDGHTDQSKEPGDNDLVVDSFGRDDFHETHLPPPVARSRRSSTYRSGQRNQGGSPLQISHTTYAEASGLSIQKKHMVVDSDCGPSSQPSKLRDLDDLREIPPNRGGSALQECSTRDGHTESKEPGDNDLVVDSFGCEIGSSHSFERARFGKLFQSVFNHGFRKSTGRDDLLRDMMHIVRDRNIQHPDNVPMLHARVNQHLNETELEWKNVFLEAQSVSKKENEVLQKRVEELSNELVRCRVVCPKVKLDTAGNPVHEVAQEHGSSNIATQRDILALKEYLQREILSLKETMRVVPSEPQKRYSHKYKSSLKLKSGQDNNLEQLDPICGSYADEAPTPKLLDSALSNAKTAVKEFQKAFVDSVKSREDKSWDPMNPDVFFARPKHLCFYVKSTVNEIFFKGFENESFNTMFGMSRFLDPDVRQAKFFRYYLHEQEQNSTVDIVDPQFKEFCEAKASLLCKRFQSMPVNWLEELGDPKLASTFSSAARSVWLLHKLAYSFEPPAFIFRVARGSDVDPHYMMTVVNLEDNDKFIPKVGFMITPGLRLRKTVMRCEVYLAGST